MSFCTERGGAVDKTTSKPRKGRYLCAHAKKTLHMCVWYIKRSALPWKKIKKGFNLCPSSHIRFRASGGLVIYDWFHEKKKNAQITHPRYVSILRHAVRKRRLYRTLSSFEPYFACEVIDDDVRSCLTYL